ncbi:uncharacterized protein LODBEIA_P04800 [Lodderomyces beijingensis]|uniref:Importin N-terminal domain-containing protein n=1 Tax=Lodderomyces beijingensis TaxID=1775926 RepID=A0ABP0ZHF5_9ASCO
MSWTPDQNAIEQLKHIFKGTLSPNNEERRLANEALIDAKQNSEFENYLFTLLVVDDSTRADVRAAAGINLKNAILKNKQHENIERSYLMANIMQGLASSDNLVRNTTGSVIASLFAIYGLDYWGSALSDLLHIAQQPLQPGNNFKTQEAAMSTLAKICEDSVLELDREVNGNRPLNYLMAELLKLLDSPSVKIKAYAVHCINQFILMNTQSFLVILDPYLSKTFQLAQETDGDTSAGGEELKKNICTSFLTILETRPDKVAPHLDGIIHYCTHLMQNDQNDSAVALEACEFMLALATNVEFAGVFNSETLKTILPLLLEKMVYSEDEIVSIELANERDDSHMADKDEDIKPKNAKSKDARSANGTDKRSDKLGEVGSDDLAKGNDGADGNTNNVAVNDDDDDEDANDDDDDDGDDDEIGWSVRKCAAATLDVLSEHLPQEVLLVALPILQERILSDQWPVREAAILAFGAMSTSFTNLASDRLPQLVPYLVDKLQDPQPTVRQITCWTLSRYAAWVAAEAHEGGVYASYFQPTFESIIACTLDPKKVVQEAACSALSSFIDASDSSLIVYYLQPLLEQFAKCFHIYQRKNMSILYDCVQTFVEKMGYENLSQDPKYLNILLPPLLQKWERLSDEDAALWPLIECMASVAATSKELFAPYAVPVYERAMKILSNCILEDQTCQTDVNVDVPEKDFMVTSLDLIDGLVQGFEYQSIDLIQHDNSSSDLSNILLACFDDYNQDVRQSAFALLGDLAIFVVDVLKPYVHPIFLSIGKEITNRTHDTFPVHNNAIWALGEMIIRLPAEETKQYWENFINLLIPILNTQEIESTVLENCAITLGRMGLYGSEAVAPRLAEFILPWSQNFVYLDDNEEKQTGLTGIIKSISLNPDNGFGGLNTQQGKKKLAKFLEVLAAYQDANSELQSLFLNLITSFKQLVGDEVWNNQVLNYVDPTLRQALTF